METALQAQATPARTETVLERAVRRELERLDQAGPPDADPTPVLPHPRAFATAGERRWAGSPKG